MISKKIQDAFNAQLNAEAYSSYLYLAMAAHCTSMNLDGMAGWLRAQSAEEWQHAMKFYRYLHDRGGTVELAAIDAPKDSWKSPLALFESVLKHEQKVTRMIDDLVTLAAKEDDPAASVFLQWFVTEQVEEESNAEKIVAKLRLIGDSANGLFMMDHELGKRKAE
jgi:ferritin